MDPCIEFTHKGGLASTATKALFIVESVQRRTAMKLYQSWTFCILVWVSQFCSGVGIAASIWLLVKADDATAKDDPEKWPLWLATGVVIVGLVWFVVVIGALTIRKACEKSMCCRFIDLLAYTNSYFSSLNAVLALGAQIAYMGYGDFATSESDFTKWTEVVSISFVIVDMICGSVVSFLSDWNKEYKEFFDEFYSPE